MSVDADYRCGFVAVVGRPNVGKSTLVNALVDAPVSIVTPKPQTTRHQIRGIRTTDDTQIVFVDTPGLHQTARKAMNRVMNKVAANAIVDADLVLFVVAALQFTDEDAYVLDRITRQKHPVVLCINKVDRVKPKEALLPFIDQLHESGSFAEVVPVSATRRVNLEALTEAVVSQLPVSEPLYPFDQVTDRGEAFHTAEIVRAQLMMQLQQELPYGTTVEIERHGREQGRRVIDAIIWVERASQKAIVIGHGGERIREIGRAARLALNEYFSEPVHLELWVKVKENWADNERLLKSLGYELS